MKVIETRQLAKNFDFLDVLTSVDLTVRGSADRRIVAYPLALSRFVGSFCLAYYQVLGISFGAFGLEWIAVLCPSVVGIFLAYRAWVRLPEMETGRIN